MKGLLTRKPVLFVLRSLLLLAIPLSVTLFTLQHLQGSSNTGVRSVKATGPSVPQYEKFELIFPYTGSYSNPHDPSQVDVEAVFTAPSGQMQQVPGFFFQDFTRSG